MKATGITRPLDRMGRLVIPAELREIFDFNIGTPVEIFTEGETIILKKHECTCVFCGSNEDLTQFKSRSICSNCWDEIINK
jgi:transcriptional pleiotropic regulator of transition state genes